MSDESQALIWVFTNGGHFPGGVFSEIQLAEKWIRRHRLSGTLTQYPVDEGCFDWAERCGLIGMTPETLDVKRTDP